MIEWRVAFLYSFAHLLQLACRLTTGRGPRQIEHRNRSIFLVMSDIAILPGHLLSVKAIDRLKRFLSPQSVEEFKVSQGLGRLPPAFFPEPRQHDEQDN